MLVSFLRLYCVFFFYLKFFNITLSKEAPKRSGFIKKNSTEKIQNISLNKIRSFDIFRVIFLQN